MQVKRSHCQSCRHTYCCRLRQGGQLKPRPLDGCSDGFVSTPFISRSRYDSATVPVSAKTRILLGEPLLRNPKTETALQLLSWHSEGQPFQPNSLPVECSFRRPPVSAAPQHIISFCYIVCDVVCYVLCFCKIKIIIQPAAAEGMRCCTRCRLRSQRAASHRARPHPPAFCPMLRTSGSGRCIGRS